MISWNAHTVGQVGQHIKNCYFRAVKSAHKSVYIPNLRQVKRNTIDFSDFTWKSLQTEKWENKQSFEKLDIL